jgi:phosphoglycolate phosphatase
MNPFHSQNIDSILFDLDGTLWDASATCTKAWNETLRSAHQDYPEIDEAKVRSFSGQTIDQIFREHFHDIPVENHPRLIQAYQEAEDRLVSLLGGVLYPSVRHLLPKLHEHYKLFIISNCLNGYIQHFIRLNHFESVITDFECSGATGLPKSDNIRLIAERNGLVHPVYVGDTPWDREAASKNKMPFVYAAYGFGKVDGADWQISEFASLSALLPK